MSSIKNRQKVVKVTYIKEYNVIELKYDDYMAIGCLAQVENPKAPKWHEKKRFSNFYVLPCPKSMRNSYFSELFASEPAGECSKLENSKSYSMFSHRICEECFKDLVSYSKLECYCLALDKVPESNHTKRQKEKRNKQMVLAKKHKEESDKLESLLQEQRKKLEAKQRRELESEQVKEQLETEKAKKAEIVDAKREETEKAQEEYVKRISKLEEKLKDLEEDVDAGHDLVSQLTISHRQANDEVEDARTTIMSSRMLHKYGTSEIGVKVLGQVNTDGWWEECKDHFGANAETFGAWQSRIDEMLRKQSFNPIKVVPDGKGGNKNVIDEDDEELTKLRKTYSPLVANAVGVAALEIATWNPSGRYNISMPWDFNTDQKASMSQIFQLFGDVLQKQEQEIEEKDKQLKALRLAPAPKRRRGLA